MFKTWPSFTNWFTLFCLQGNQARKNLSSTFYSSFCLCHQITSSYWPLFICSFWPQNVGKIFKFLEWLLIPFFTTCLNWLYTTLQGCLFPRFWGLFCWWMVLTVLACSSPFYASLKRDSYRLLRTFCNCAAISTWGITLIIAKLSYSQIMKSLFLSCPQVLLKTQTLWHWCAHCFSCLFSLIVLSLFNMLLVSLILFADLLSRLQVEAFKLACPTASLLPSTIPFL